MHFPTHPEGIDATAGRASSATINRSSATPNSNDVAGGVRVLLVAEVCNPDWPSLPTAGYKITRAIADQTNAVVVTQIRNKPAIDRVGIGSAEVVYLNTEAIASPLHAISTFLRGGTESSWSINTAFEYLNTLVFEWRVWKHFEQDLRAGRFDVVHRVTPMSPTLASPLATWSPVPYVLGPLNGGLPWPQEFVSERRRDRDWLAKFRSVHKSFPYYRRTYDKANVILASFQHTIRDLPVNSLPRTINFPEVGFDPRTFYRPEADGSRKMDVVLAGRLVPCKLPEVVIRAFASRPLVRNNKLIIIGDGPERSRIEAMIRENQLTNCVEMVGQASHEQVAAYMRGASILAFPSIKELGGNVVVEAMACGMACIATDYGGPGDLLADGRGIRVKLGNLDALIERFAGELEHLIVDPERVSTLGERAHQYVTANYAWKAKAGRIVDIYRDLLDGGGHG